MIRRLASMMLSWLVGVVEVWKDTYTQRQPSAKDQLWSGFDKLGSNKTNRTIDVMRVMEPIANNPSKPNFCLVDICNPMTVGTGNSNNIKSVMHPKAACVT